MSDDFKDGGADFGETPDVVEQPKRKGGAKAILGLLKFVGIGLGALIFIVAIVVVTVSILNRQSKPLTAVPTSEDYQRATPIYATFTAIEPLTTTTTDKEAWSIYVKLNLAYEETNKDILTELTARRYQIQDALRNYFSTKAIADLMPDRERILKEEIREMINRMLTAPSLKDVYFQEFKRTQM